MTEEINEQYNQVIVEEIDAADNIISNGEINFTSFEAKNELNPKVFTKGGKLQPKIRKQLGKITSNILEDMNIPDEIVSDVILVGSIVSYHYSSYSDFDLHIVINMRKYSSETDLVRRWLDDERKIWNLEHDITLMGYDVEIYFQDITDEVETNGLYSVIDDKWIKEPEPEDYVLDVKTIRKQAIKLIDKIDQLDSMETPSLRTISRICSKIVNGRRESLRDGGEFSVGNIVFKILRRTGHIEKLWNLRRKVGDKKLSK